MPTLEIKIKQTEARRGQVTCPRVYSKSQSLNARSLVQNPHYLPGITLPFTTNKKGLYWWREVAPNHCLQSMIQKTLAPQHVSWQNKGSLVKCWTLYSLLPHTHCRATVSTGIKALINFVFNKSFYNLFHPAQELYLYNTLLLLLRLSTI